MVRIETSGLGPRWLFRASLLFFGSPQKSGRVDYAHSAPLGALVGSEKKRVEKINNNVAKSYQLDLENVSESTTPLGVEMATTEPKPMTTQELTDAMGVLLKREEVRAEQDRLKRRRRILRRRKETETAIKKLAHSIEVIKWCIVGIATVMAISLITVIMVVMEVEREAERIKGEVQGIQREAETIVREIEREAQSIRDKIRHPFESLGGTLGGTLGRQLENKVFGGSSSSNSED